MMGLSLTSPMKKHPFPLQPIALGLSLGVIWSLSMIFLALIELNTTTIAWVQEIGKFYVGFDVTVQGIIAGAIWGFIDGFILGFLVAWFYNLFAKKA